MGRGSDRIARAEIDAGLVVTRKVDRKVARQHQERDRARDPSRQRTEKLHARLGTTSRL